MFQSIEYTKYLVVDEKTKLYSHEYELTDSDFRCSVVADILVGEVGAVIQEYSKRNLDVAANLVKFFLFFQKKYGYSIAKQIEWSEGQPFFTAKIKADLQKYLTLL